MQNKKNIKDKKVIILTHIITSVPSEDLEAYFVLKKVKKLLYIAHPLFYRSDRPGSHYRIYEHGRLKKQHKLQNKKLFSIYQYLRDTLLTFYWVFTWHEKADIIIALDNLNALAAIFLKKIGITSKVIYYTIDYTPQRFKNNLMNNIYHSIDKYCVKNADLTWNLSARMAEGREKKRNMKRSIYNRQIVVPIGMWLNRIARPSFKDINIHTVAYAGGLSAHQGIQLVLDSIPYIIPKVPDFKFIIIGLGDYESKLKEKVKLLKIEKYVKFYGYFEKHEDVEKKLSYCGLGVAMYNEKLSKWSYYADPSKIKTYLACGLPVLTTSFINISEELVKNKCGLVVTYEKKELANNIIKLLINVDMQKTYRANAIKFIQQYNWENIYDTALSSII